MASSHLAAAHTKGKCHHRRPNTFDLHVSNLDESCVCLQPDLQGILPVVDGSFTQVQKNAFRWPAPLKQAVAVCNALTLINKKHVVGDVSEQKAFEAVEAQFLVSWYWGFVSLTDSTHGCNLTDSNSKTQTHNL